MTPTHTSFIIFVLVAAGTTRLYLQPSQGPQHQLHQDGTDMREVTDLYFPRCGDIAGDGPSYAGCRAGLWKGIRPAAGPVPATVPRRHGRSSGRILQSDLQLVTGVQFSDQKH